MSTTGITVFPDLDPRPPPFTSTGLSIKECDQRSILVQSQTKCQKKATERDRDRHIARIGDQNTDLDPRSTNPVE